MKTYRIERVMTFAAWALALSMFMQASAQQARRGSSQRKARTAVPEARFSSGESALKIPLDIDNNIIRMQIRVNNSKPLKFIFDTGATLSAINSQRAAELGLKPQGKMRGNATGGAIHGSYTTGVSLSVQGAEVSNQLVALFPFSTPPGFEFDGVIGYDFINQFVVEIDYRNKSMNLYNPRTYTYSGTGEVVPLLLKGRRTPLVRTKIVMEGRAPVEGRLEVDTGSDGTFVINSPFVKRQKLVQSFQKTVAGSGRGAGGEQKLLFGNVKAVELGRFVFDNPPVGLSLDTEGSGASEENDGLIGSEIFRRFKVILDYSRQRMILEPNESFKEPYELDMGALPFASPVSLTRHLTAGAVVNIVLRDLTG
ncbi:MAG TPA: retropepsin-like aspartic protease [Pyrinomonadaceae bacterium]|nr:retropepsin-like aspartic protease [Pyrinomonadaceae bacterium]